MKIVALIEDTKQDDQLINEFGLSLYIESNGVKMVLDTGASGQFIKNKLALGIDLNNVQLIVLSHAHADHCGGIFDLLQINSRATVYMHCASANAYYGNIGSKLPRVVNYFIHPFIKRSKAFSKYIGLDQDQLRRYEKRIRYISKTEALADNITLVTDVQKKYPLPEGNKFLLTLQNNQLTLDEFHHELIMVIREHNGMVVFTGCCHSGVLNMLDAVQARFNDIPIKAVVGGFHLKLQPAKDNMAGDRHAIQCIADELFKRKIKKIYTGHCTGSKAYNILKERLGDRIEPIFTGCSIRL